MIKVLFYHANEILQYGSNNEDTYSYLGIAALYLKTHLEITNPDIASQIEWLVPAQTKLSDSELVEYCNKVKPDILCTSHYIWNHTFLMEQLHRVKADLPQHMIIAAGGPSIDVNINKTFFDTFPYIDYAMYGPGEQSFADMIASILTGKKLVAFNTSNLAWFDKEKKTVIVSNFKYVPQNKISPFLHNKELFSKMVKNLQEKNTEVVIPYELTRGCPYSCTFCDWNSGLSNKVSRRKDTYKDEIDLFQSLSIKKIYLADANVGQYNEDVEMIRYFAYKNLYENAAFEIDGNYSKLRKDNNLKIYHLLGQANLVTDQQGFTLSVQDINEKVLENIDRPDVGWDTHLNIINELKETFPSKHCKIQIIQGLPGQTVKTWRETLSQICKNKLVLMPFISELLPASPAARDKQYQEKFKFEYSNSMRYESGLFLRGTIPKSCISYTQRDFVTMTMLTIIYGALAFYTRAGADYALEDTVDDFLISDNYKILSDNLYENWTKNDSFYFTMDLDLNQKIVSASNLYGPTNNWKNSMFLFKLVAKHNNKKDLFKKMIKVNDNKFKVGLESLKAF
jgi:tRNA A37 methylthiotransferase MiaB